MPWLKVNGLTLPVALKSFTERVREIGETTSAMDGTLRKSRLAIKRDCEFKSTPMVSADALAWDSLLRGLGERYSFDSHLYGSKGSAPSSSAGSAESATQSKFGGKSLKLTATTGDITYPNTGAAVPGCCYFFWHYNGATWDAWAYNYESAAFQKYKNYVATGSTPSGITVTAALTSIRIQGSGTDQFVDDLVALPFSVPATWITSSQIPVGTEAFSDLPKLSVAGDVIHEAAIRTCMGNVESGELLTARLGGAVLKTVRILSVSMQEV